jgi:hypothetical protein
MPCLVPRPPMCAAFLPEIAGLPKGHQKLQACRNNTIKLTRVDHEWLIGDLDYAIVNLDCDDEDAHKLCQRLEFIQETRKGSLRAWF